jgi:hypothetical protein
MTNRGRRVKSESGLRYRRVDGRMLIYDDQHRLDVPLSSIYINLATPSSDSWARSVVAALDQLRVAAGTLGVTWASPPVDIRRATDTLLITRYGVAITGSIGRRRTIRIGNRNNANTVATVLSALRVGMSSLVDVGVRGREKENPLTYHRLEVGALSKYRRTQRMLDIHSPFKRRVPISYYQIVGGTATPISIAADDQFPAAIRAAGTAVGWSWRDHAVAEIMIAGGPRITEACEAVVGGWCAVTSELRVHDKGRGRAPLKTVTLSAAAQTALATYWHTERPQMDPLYLQFLAWAAPYGATYALPDYLRFLASCGRDPITEPLFLTTRGTRYTAATWRRVAWTKACRAAGLSARSHHLRHWYVNSQLRHLEAEHGDDDTRHAHALVAFSGRMGWQSWTTLRHYDHRGVACALLNRLMLTPIDAPPQKHGVLSTFAKQFLPPVRDQ